MLIALLAWFIWYFFYSPMALFDAAYNGDAAGVEAILKRGVPVNSTPIGSSSAVIMASVGKTHQIEVLKVLLRHRASINATTRTGNTALMLSAERNRIEVVRFLLDHGADANRRNDRGQTAKQMAMWKGNSQIVEMLEQTGRK